MSIYREPSNARHRFACATIVPPPRGRAIALVVIAALTIGSPVFAQHAPAPLMSFFAARALAAEAAPGLLKQASVRSIQQWLPTPALAGSVSIAKEASPRRGWVRRHPALFGALLGAGGGAIVGYGLGQDCTGRGACSSKGRAAVVGAALFAGAGALVGIAVDRASK